MPEDYSQKENYITFSPDPNTWRYHANYKIMSFYSNYIRGVVGDCGCNHGACTILLTDFAPKVELIYGFDMNIDALKIGYDIANSMQLPVSINFITADLLNLPIEEAKFDFLMSFHTLEHIYPNDVDGFVKEMFRVLKPNGHFLISIPYDRAYPDPAHVGFYTVETLVPLFENQGFETIECMLDNRWNEKKLLTALFKKIENPT